MWLLSEKDGYHNKNQCKQRRTRPKQHFYKLQQDTCLLPARANDPLIATRDKYELTRSRLLKILVTIGKNSGVSKVHPHRFRHTLAIQYIRNGGDPYTLQALLGHSSRTYAKIQRKPENKGSVRSTPPLLSVSFRNVCKSYHH